MTKNILASSPTFQIFNLLLFCVKTLSPGIFALIDRRVTKNYISPKRYFVVRLLINVKYISVKYVKVFPFLYFPQIFNNNLYN